jgi:ubiquitin-protein ligase
VTAGGSICIEALTLSGTAGSWTSQYNMEAILNIVILNMIGKLLSQQHLA